MVRGRGGEGEGGVGRIGIRAPGEGDDGPDSFLIEGEGEEGEPMPVEQPAMPMVRGWDSGWDMLKMWFDCLWVWLMDKRCSFHVARWRGMGIERDGIRLIHDDSGIRLKLWHNV